MTRILKVVFAALVFFSVSASAAERHWQLVCFSEEGHSKVLSMVKNRYQYLASWNDREFRRAMQGTGCDHAHIPAGSKGVFKRFYASEKLIFPEFLVTFKTTGQKMYSADEVFPTKHWEVRTFFVGYFDQPGDEIRKGRTRGERGERRYPEGTVSHKIVPRTCDVMHEFLRQSNGFVPDYMLLPSDCQVYLTN